MSQKNSVNKIDLGVCLYHVYRAPGDLYDSWDIVPFNDGNPERLPDARYGVDQPDYSDLTVEDYLPQPLFEIREHYDVNGWSQWETRIVNEKGHVIASRSC